MTVRQSGKPGWPQTMMGLLRRADSFCINQDDIPERNHQVLSIARIYGSAASVSAWLGTMSRGGYWCQRQFNVRCNAQNFSQKQIVGNLCWSRMWINQEFLLNTVCRPEVRPLLISPCVGPKMDPPMGALNGFPHTSESRLRRLS